MAMLINFIAFQVGWFSSVIGAAKQMPWLGPLVLLFVLAIHFKQARRPHFEMALDHRVRHSRFVFRQPACCFRVGILSVGPVQRFPGSLLDRDNVDAVRHDAQSVNGLAERAADARGGVWRDRRTGVIHSRSKTGRNNIFGLLRSVACTGHRLGYRNALPACAVNKTGRHVGRVGYTGSI